MSHPTAGKTKPAGPYPILEWALWYATLGWSVVPVHTPSNDSCSCGRLPCPSAGKHPRIRWQESTSHPTEPEQITEWWGRWPDANVGVVTGLVSGVSVIDIDPRNGGDRSLRSLEHRWGPMPVTPEVRTGGGGSHLWFGEHDQVSSGVVAPGIDLKSEGGLIVVPPSMHVSGHRYLWRPGGAPSDLRMPPLPGWVAEEAASSGESGDRDPRPPVRTTSERTEFSDAWAQVGVELVPGDRYYLCPFHDDHHPSLHIDADGCRWYCFGCSIGGGIGRLLEVAGQHHVPAARPRLRGATGRGLPITLHGEREIDVVGESRHQDELLELTGGRRRYGGVDVEAVAELVAEPTNEADPDAVAVMIDGRHVGYIRREDVTWLKPLLDDSTDLHGMATCRAAIRGGWDRGGGEVGWFGVVLWVPSPSG
jgi:hypothetical protein